MEIQSSHLRFLPRSLQLGMPPPPMDTDKTKKKKKQHMKSIDHSTGEDSKLSPNEEFEPQLQRKRKIKNAGVVIENDSTKTNPFPPATWVDGDSSGFKKNKKKRDESNKHSAEAEELKQLIAEFLSSRGLTNTLSVFLSETQHVCAGKAQNLDLEEIYGHYLNQGGSKFKKQEEVNQREQAGDAALKNPGKLNKGVKGKGKDIKTRDVKEKYADDADAAPPSIGGGALESRVYKSDNNHDTVKMSMDDLDGHGHSKKTAKHKRNSAALISNHEGRNELPKPTDGSGLFSELSEPVSKLQNVPMKEKRKKKMTEESILSNNSEQVDGKKNKKGKKARAVKLFSTGSQGINAEAVNGSMLDLLHDSRNELDIKKSSLDKTILRAHEGLSDNKKSKKEKKQFEEKLHSISSQPINGEVVKGSRGYLPEDPKNLSDIQVSKKKRRSGEMMPGDAEEHINCKKSKREKKTLEEKLLSADLYASYPINVEVAMGSREYSSEDPGNTLYIGLPKKKKRLDNMSPRDAEEQISGKNCKKGKKALAENFWSTDTHSINGQAVKGTIEDLSEDPGNSLHIKVSKKMKSDEMVVRGNEDLTDGYKSKKRKKGFEEKLCSSSSHAVNGEMVKENMRDLAVDTNNTLDFAPDCRILKAKELVEAEVQSKDDCAAVNGYQEKGIPGKLHIGKEEIEGQMPAKSRKSEQQKSDVATAAKPFQKVSAEEVKFADPRLQDNSYWAKDGAENGYGAKAQAVLGQVRGKNFRHEKTKKKRGTYTGGMIDVQSHSVKFSFSDEE